MARVIEVTTPLEKDVLLFHKMRATEEMSRLFEYELELFSSDGEVDLDEVLGKSITITLERADEGVRYFNGLCSRISQGGREGRYHVYLATVRPWLWFLTRTKNYRIFQEMNVPDILKEIFSRHSAIADVQDELTDSYAPWTYCVQYNESDFAFVSRLMEHEGIYYYFKHSEGKHTLVLADSYSAHEAAYEDEIPFIPPQERVRPEREHVSEWSISRELQPGKYALAAYDFEKPSVDLQVRSNIKRTHALAEYEVFEYGGDYVDRGDGELYARTRIEEVQAKYERTRGATNARALAPGYMFKLGSHPRADQNAEYLVVSAEYQMQAGQYEGRDTAPAEYSCRFTALNSQFPFRSERLTPKPIVHGPQTARVVGASGEDIYTDKFGRVKVHFYWDRNGKGDDGDSCWIRVSQNWGGKGWGGMFIPHVGQEVIVQFEGGDPDLPLITGRVYNAEQMPPVELPGGKTKSIIRDHGANEIIMEGDGGKQRITMFSPHASTTFSMGAPNSPGPGFFFRTDAEWHEFVERNKSTEITGDKEELYHRNLTQQVDGDVKQYIKGHYVCQVNDYQEYSTYGHYVTKVFGYNWVIIVGTDTDIYLSAQQCLNVGTHVNLYANALLELSKAHEIRKIPKVQKLEGKVQERIGDALYEVGRKMQKIAGTSHTKASKIAQQVNDCELYASSGVKFKMAKYALHARVTQWVGDTIKAKGKKIFHGGETKVNNALKVSE